MKKEEFDILGIKKTKQGKSYAEIKKEINYLNGFQKEIRSDKKLIIRQQKIIDKLENKIEKQKKEIFNLGLNSDSQINNQVTIGDIKKVIATVSFDTVPKQEIRALCNLTLKKLDIVLSFLGRNKLIKKEFKGRILYFKKC